MAIEGYTEFSHQRYDNLGLAAAHNFREDKSLVEVMFVREKPRNEHGIVIYTCYMMNNGHDEPIGEFRYKDSTKITGEEIQKHLLRDVGRRLPNAIRLRRPEKDETLVGIFFKEEKYVTPRRFEKHRTIAQ